MCNTSPFDGNICKVLKLCIFIVLFLGFMLPLVTTTGSDEQLLRHQKNLLHKTYIYDILYCIIYFIIYTYLYIHIYIYISYIYIYNIYILSYHTKCKNKSFHLNFLLQLLLIFSRVFPGVFFATWSVVGVVLVNLNCQICASELNSNTLNNNVEMKEPMG